MNEFEIWRLVAPREHAIRKLREDLDRLTDGHDLAYELFEALGRRLLELERRAPRRVEDVNLK